MVPRLAVLFAFACVCGTAAVTVSRAQADDRGAARIPAIPVAAPDGERCPIPHAYRPLFVEAASETRLPLALLVAVARVESQFVVDAQSSAGAQGLLQVMPTTAAELELDARVPRENVLAGARYLRLLFDRFRSSELALAAYNAGPNAVARAGGPPTGETLTYVADVTSVWRSLSGCT